MIRGRVEQSADGGSGLAVSKDDTAAIGRAIYDEKIRDKMTPEDKGKLVVIDIHSGDYEIDSDDAAALFRLIERRPDAFTWAKRVGYRTPYVMGFRFARSDEEPNFNTSRKND